MSREVFALIMFLIFFGWIPILAIAKAITMIIESRTCSKCTCKNCCEDMADEA